MADLTTSKVLWNSVLSTELAKYMCIDIKHFYLCMPMDRYEYMHMPLDIFPEHIIQQYDLRNKAKNGKVYLEIRCPVHGLPQSGKLANDYLKAKLAPTGYYEVQHTQGLWKHISLSRPVLFTLVVENFGVRYVGKENIKHLIHVLKKDIIISEDWTESLYCGIILKWEYGNRTLIFLIPGYKKS